MNQPNTQPGNHEIATTSAFVFWMPHWGQTVTLASSDIHSNPRAAKYPGHAHQVLEAAMQHAPDDQPVGAEGVNMCQYART